VDRIRLFPRLFSTAPFALPLLQKPLRVEGLTSSRERELRTFLTLISTAQGNQCPVWAPKTRQRECEPFLSGFGDQRDVMPSQRRHGARTGFEGLFRLAVDRLRKFETNDQMFPMSTSLLCAALMYRRNLIRSGRGMHTAEKYFPDTILRIRSLVRTRHNEIVHAAIRDEIKWGFAGLVSCGRRSRPPL